MLSRDQNMLVLMRRLLGAIQSGSPAARLGIFLKGLAPFTRILDRLFFQRDNINKYISEIPTCLMVISPPRSGSTITYQVLTRAVPSVYISNLHFLFPNGASSYMIRNNLFGTSRTGFQNYYGHTPSFTDVNEGNEIVEAILNDGADKELIRERFIKFVQSMRATPERPLIFKNVRAYSEILRLHEAVPELIFLRIKRNPEQTIQSVLHAYHELGTFHPIPASLQSKDIENPIEFAVHQILEIERIIELQKKQIKPAVWLEWSYEDFCLDTEAMITNIAQNFLGMSLSDLHRDAIPKLKTSTRVKVSKYEADHIQFLLQQAIIKGTVGE